MNFEFDEICLQALCLLVNIRNLFLSPQNTNKYIYIVQYIFYLIYHKFEYTNF